MWHGRYVGPRPELLGRSALVRPTSDSDMVLAQFDFPPGTEFDPRSGRPLGTLESVAHLTTRNMVPDFGQEHPECFSWHTFPSEDFRPTEDMINEVTPL